MGMKKKGQYQVRFNFFVTVRETRPDSLNQLKRDSLVWFDDI